MKRVSSKRNLYNRIYIPCLHFQYSIRLKNDVFNYNSVFELILHEFQLDDAIFINKNSIEASFLIISASPKISETMHSTLFN